MTYNLDAVVFENDFATLSIGDGATVIFNLVDEQLINNNEELDINAVNIAVIDSDGNYYTGENIIGMGDSFYTLATDYKQYLGHPLDKDNLKYCTLEVEDE